MIMTGTATATTTTSKRNSRSGSRRHAGDPFVRLNGLIEVEVDEINVDILELHPICAGILSRPVNTFSPSPDDPADSIRVMLAEGRFAEALDEFRRLEGRPVPPDLQLMAATAATRLGDLGLGAALAEASLERFRARADDDGRMRAQNLLGVIEFERGNLERSQQGFTEALGLARALKDTLMTARACNNLASIADLQGDAPGALTLYRSSLLSYQRLGDRRGTAESYHNLGICVPPAGRVAGRRVRGEPGGAARRESGGEIAVGIAVMGRAEIDLHRGAGHGAAATGLGRNPRSRIPG